MKGKAPIFGMVGVDQLFALAKTRAVASGLPLDEVVFSREERDRVVAASMPPAAAEAWERGKQFARVHQEQRRRSQLAEQARFEAGTHYERTLNQSAATPAPPTKDNTMNNTNLSALETATAQGLIARMAMPLSAEERHVCKVMGLTEAAYKDQRDREIEQALPGWHAGMGHGLDAGELKVCHALGVTPEAYAAEKARRA